MSTISDKPKSIRFPSSKQMLGDAIRCDECGFGIIPTGYTYFWYDKDEKGNKIFSKKHTRFGLCGCFKNDFYHNMELLIKNEYFYQYIYILNFFLY